MNRGSKSRILDLTLAVPAFTVLLPLMFVIGMLIVLGSPGPAVFRQHRVGRHGRIFTFYKFRTMREDPDAVHLSVADGQRVTGLGKILRKTKLDELPQLWNVIKGDIGFVGPRPEIPQYVDMEDLLWREVLESRPGITSPTTIALKNEERLIDRVSGDRQGFYRNFLLPYKLSSYIRYERSRNILTDIVVIIQTFGVIIFSRLIGVQVFNTIQELRASVRELESEGFVIERDAASRRASIRKIA